MTRARLIAFALLVGVIITSAPDSTSPSSPRDRDRTRHRPSITITSAPDPFDNPSIRLPFDTPVATQDKWLLRTRLRAGPTPTTAASPAPSRSPEARRDEGEQLSTPFTFAVAADARYFSGPDYDTSQYFRGVCETIAALGGGAFMVSPGDIDPTTDVKWTITRTLGITYTWYPVVGNHELPITASSTWRASGSWTPGTPAVWETRGHEALSFSFT